MKATLLTYNMSTDKREEWIFAAKKLIKNPEEKVICPQCKEGVLRISDVKISEIKKTDRYLICDSCGHYNVITMNSND